MKKFVSNKFAHSTYICLLFRIALFKEWLFSQFVSSNYFLYFVYMSFCEERVIKMAGLLQKLQNVLPGTTEKLKWSMVILCIKTIQLCLSSEIRFVSAQCYTSNHKCHEEKMLYTNSTKNWALNHFN